MRFSLVLVALVVFPVLGMGANEHEAVTVLRGAPDPSAVESDVAVDFVLEGGGTVTLQGDRFWIGQLRDPQLKERAWEIETRAAGKDTYHIVAAYTVKDGKRFRVTYYCDVCHIRTHDPGRCMCCQEETVLQEIPAEDFGAL